MSKERTHFYEKYINMTKLENELSELRLKESEYNRLLDIANKVIYMEITHFILSEVGKKHKHEIFTQIEYFPHERATAVLVKSLINDFDRRVSVLTDMVVQEFISRINDYLMES